MFLHISGHLHLTWLSIWWGLNLTICFLFASFVFCCSLPFLSIFFSTEYHFMVPFYLLCWLLSAREDQHSLLGSLTGSGPRNPLQAVGWRKIGPKSFVFCLSEISGLHWLMPIVLTTIDSYIVSCLWAVSGRRVNLISVTPFWVEVEIPIIIFLV